MSDIKTQTGRDSESNSKESKISFFDLNPNQIENLAQDAASKAIEETWAMGMPITTEVDGRMCKKYSDGRIEWM